MQIASYLDPDRQPIPVITMSPREFNARKLAGFIDHFYCKHQRPPTIREMRLHFGLASGTMQVRVQRAVELGLVKRAVSDPTRRYQSRRYYV